MAAHRINRTTCRDCESPLDGASKTYCKRCACERVKASRKARYAPKGPRAKRTVCKDCEAPLDGPDPVRCRACKSAFDAAKYLRIGKHAPGRADCSVCGRERDGSHKSYCKVCLAAYAAQRRAADPGKVRAQQAAWQKANRDRMPVYKWRSKLVRYGFTKAEADAFLASTDHQCAICDKELVIGQGANGVNVDHDHETGEYRGVLCTPCNTGLGLFRDDIFSLQTAVEYLRTHRKKHLRKVV